MDTIAWLHLRKAWQLKYACFLTGLPITGTKTELANTLGHAFGKSRPTAKRKRIVSVDMGIRNLAVCVLDAPRPVSGQRQTALKDQPLKVVAWGKTDILTRVASVPSSTKEPTEEVTESPKKVKAIAAANFSPSILSEVAYELTEEWLKTYSPDEIIIERQRFRSAGASSVQEWTLRVNMLESMLWACLRTLQNVSQQESSGRKNQFPMLEEVSPKRVANFWCSSPLAPTRQVTTDLLVDGTESETRWKQLESKKIEKKDKIAAVRSWLSGEASKSEVQLEFTDETRLIANAFLAETGRGPKRKTQELPERLAGIGKLDDLADCLLQAVAWVKWEENRSTLWRLMQDAIKTPK